MHTSQQSPQAIDPTTEQEFRALDLSHRPRQIGDPLPAICTVNEVADVLRVCVSQVHRLRREGKLSAFLLPTIGRARYSGQRLLAYERGELTSRFINGNAAKPRTFGRKRTA